MKDICGKYPEVFVKDPEDIGLTDLVYHHVEVQSDKPVRASYHRTPPPSVREQIDRETEKLLATGIIRESTSPYCAPIVLWKNKDGIRYCYCVDYRLLHKKVLCEASWPLTNIQDHLRQFDKPKVFSSLDLLSGYF